MEQTCLWEERGRERQRWLERGRERENERGREREGGRDSDRWRGGEKGSKRRRAREARAREINGEGAKVGEKVRGIGGEREGESERERGV